ncbi:hypothetical protein CVT25_003163 [Psilocybe cyanescens]|uniref:Uncharacterized protein n=1 Tax=Psilocybe cyanescens TaxID=93625 RepID=A0A409XEY6_PSICY|nr:hypothetical protein CVT25_003163 [Psilocybe cyanescens]
MTGPDYAKQGYTDVTAVLEDAVLTITINPAQHRPKEFAGALYKNLLHVFELCDRDDRVRAVILTADPTAPAYCSGGDISGGWDSLWDAESEKEGEHAHRDAGGILAMAIYRCRKITIAAVNGNAAGIGMTALQLPFDFRFVWKDAKLVFPFVRRGIVPEATSTYLLPLLIGHARAAALLLTARVASPRSSPALAALYHDVLPTRDAVYPAARAFALELVGRQRRGDAESPRAGVGVQEEKEGEGEECEAYGRAKALLQHPGRSLEESYLLEEDLGGPNPSPWWRRIDIRHRKSKL